MPWPSSSSFSCISGSDRPLESSSLSIKAYLSPSRPTTTPPRRPYSHDTSKREQLGSAAHLIASLSSPAVGSLFFQPHLREIQGADLHWKRAPKIVEVVVAARLLRLCVSATLKEDSQSCFGC